MPANPQMRVGLLKKDEIEEAGRILRLAFGTFLGLPNPLEFMGDRDLLTPRWRSGHVKVLAARDAGRLVGSNVLTRWGSFGFFGPLTVLPEYWERGVAQRLLEATMAIFERWGVRHTGLYTFSNSAKHMALYQKFGYWPRYLTAIMTGPSEPKGTEAPTLLSSFNKSQREEAIQACARLTHKIDNGLDLTGEIRALLAQRIGDAVLRYTGNVLDGFAVCQNGPGSEGGQKTCYIKFGSGPRRFGGGGTFRSAAGCLRRVCVFAARDDRSRCKPGPRRCLPAHALPRISSGLVGRRHAAPAWRGVQSRGCLRN